MERRAARCRAPTVTTERPARRGAARRAARRARDAAQPRGRELVRAVPGLRRRDAAGAFKASRVAGSGPSHGRGRSALLSSGSLHRKASRLDLPTSSPRSALGPLLVARPGRPKAMRPGFRGKYVHPEFPGLRVEINALVSRDLGLWEGELHILGFGMDPADEPFEAAMEGQRDQRRTRPDGRRPSPCWKQPPVSRRRVPGYGQFDSLHQLRDRAPPTPTWSSTRPSGNDLLDNLRELADAALPIRLERRRLRSASCDSARPAARAARLDYWRGARGAVVLGLYRSGRSSLGLVDESSRPTPPSRRKRCAIRRRRRPGSAC